MNAKFSDYIKTLSPRQKAVASEAVKVFLAGECDETAKIMSGVNVYNLCRDMTLENVEHAEVLLLKQSGKLIKRVRIGSGGLTETIVDIRVLFREALLNNATSFILVHNHPSGSINPSVYDDKLTKDAWEAANIMRIRMIDHVIIGEGNYYSYQESGKLGL